MFCKKRKAMPCLRIEDPAGQVLFDAPLDRLSLPEALILRLSVEFFDDPEPCQIHRNAVTVRALAELQQCLPGGETLDVSALSPHVAGYLDEYPRAWRLCLSRETP